MIFRANVLKENLKTACLEIDTENDNIIISEVNKQDKIVFLCTHDINEVFLFLQRFYKVISIL